MPRIGVQAMMIRDSVADIGPYEAMRKLADIGYPAVEVSQIPLTADNVEQFRRARGDFGVEVGSISGSVGVPAGSTNESLTDALDKVIADCRALDCTKVRIGMLPMPALRDRQTVADFCATAEGIAKSMQDEGIQLYYHNHHVEFARVDGTRLLDLIRHQTPSMRFEIDVHWVHRGGADPATVLGEYAGAVDLVHLKDYRIGIPGPDAFDALENGDRETWSKAWSQLVQFAEVGEGNLDWKAIIDRSLESGAEYLFVEQDDQYGVDPYDALATSYRNLVDLGYGALLERD